MTIDEIIDKYSIDELINNKCLKTGKYIFPPELHFYCIVEFYKKIKCEPL